jgi:hypothetical protein
MARADLLTRAWYTTMEDEIEKVLGVFDGADEDSRVELVQVGLPGQLPTLELRHQERCGELGWITQRRIRLAAGQMPDLRDALNLMDRDARTARRPAAAHIAAARPALRVIS